MNARPTARGANEGTASCQSPSRPNSPGSIRQSAGRTSARTKSEVAPCRVLGVSAGDCQCRPSSGRLRWLYNVDRSISDAPSLNLPRLHTEPVHHAEHQVRQRSALSVLRVAVALHLQRLSAVTTTREPSCRRRRCRRSCRCRRAQRYCRAGRCRRRNRLQLVQRGREQVRRDTCSAS